MIQTAAVMCPKPPFFHMSSPWPITDKIMLEVRDIIMCGLFLKVITCIYYTGKSVLCTIFDKYIKIPAFFADRHFMDQASTWVLTVHPLPPKGQGTQ